MPLGDIVLKHYIKYLSVNRVHYFVITQSTTNPHSTLLYWRTEKNISVRGYIKICDKIISRMWTMRFDNQEKSALKAVFAENKKLGASESKCRCVKFLSVLLLTGRIDWWYYWCFNEHLGCCLFLNVWQQSSIVRTCSNLRMCLSLQDKREWFNINIKYGQSIIKRFNTINVSTIDGELVIKHDNTNTKYRDYFCNWRSSPLR